MMLPGTAARKLFIVAGLDSVPMDMGVWFLPHEAQRQHGQYCDSISMLVKAMKGGVGYMPGGTILKTRITGDRDPGYGSTSKMLGECAVCLAHDDLAPGGGALTPAFACGETLLRRLERNAGLTFELLD